MYCIPSGPDAKVDVAVLAADLRRAGVRVDVAYGDRSLKAALKSADRTGASLALIADPGSAVVKVKNLANGDQAEVAREAVVAEVVSRLSWGAMAVLRGSMRTFACASAAPSTSKALATPSIPTVPVISADASTLPSASM